MEMIQTVVIGLIILSLLVVVHEAGHYIVARLCGMRATELFIGMPCKHKLSFVGKRSGTEYGITPLLLGGYTKILGMGDIDSVDRDVVLGIMSDVYANGSVDANEYLDINDDPDAEDVSRKDLSEHDRQIVDAFAYLEDIGTIKPSPDDADIYMTVARDSRLLTIHDRGNAVLTDSDSTSDGQPCGFGGLSPEEFLRSEESHTYAGKGFWRKFAALVAGPSMNALFPYLLAFLCVMFAGTISSGTNVVGTVSGGDGIDIEPGDAIVSIDGEKTDTWNDVYDALVAKQGGKIEMTVERDGKTHDIEYDTSDVLGLSLSNETVAWHPDVITGAKSAVRWTNNMWGSIIDGYRKMTVTDLTDNTTSIVGITVMLGRSTESGAMSLCGEVMLISISLAIMNLLPILPLDGGHILVEAIGAVRRKKLSPRTQDAIAYAGLAAVMLLFAFALKNDIVRLLFK